MLGIIIKDYYESFCIKKNLLGSILGFLCIIFIVAILQNQFAYILAVGISLPVIGISTLQYSMEQDEITKYDQILLTFPLTRKDIVKAKFLSTLSFSLITNIFISLPIFLIYVFLYKTVDFNLGLFVYAFGFILTFILNAITSVGFFILGNKKGTIMYIILVVLLAFGFVFTRFTIDLKAIFTLSSTTILLIGSIIAIVLSILSYYACVKIYTRKHS